MSEGENVKVAVRVRPFNSREKARNAKLIIEMNGGQTKIHDPETPNGEPRIFNFDHSYWSHDGFKEDGTGLLQKDPGHRNASKFADQAIVYEDLGVGVMKNAWEGYNATLFAYGQTGSGKSFSVVGYGPNKGIVPQFCDNLFKQVDQKKAEGVEAEFEVSFGMLEIYNEQVRDLLNPSKAKGGLKVRQHPKKGFYAEGLSAAPVGSYKEIERKMDEGTMNRTVAATQMNATSSRAHTIVGITFVQKAKNSAGEETAKTAVVNLVDLAGSERAESTGATGDRLKEGAAINQSLSSLGNVISALADKSNGKNVRVPYRDSVLTKLLKNALGGNSKTIMIAAVSPADINYEESLGTLRYADRAKQIKNKATVNEDPTAKLIRELQEENLRLKAMFEAGGGVMPTVSAEDAEEMEGMSEADKEALKKEMEEDFRAQVEENNREMEEMKRAFEEKLAQARAEAGGTDPDEMNQKKATTAHIANLNYDTQLSGKICHFIDADQKTIGNQRGEASDIVLMGPSIQQSHGVILNEGGKFFITTTARTLVNGEPVSDKTELHHNDRIMFGTTQLYVFVNPSERDSSGATYPNVTYEYAQEEIAAKSGFDMNMDNKSKDDMLIQEDLIEMLPAVEEANSISEELDKKKKFEVILVSPEARGELKGRTKVYVKMIDLETDHEWIWERQHFLNRKFVMQEMFSKYQDDEDWQMDKENDPFEEDPNAEVHVGTVKIWLQSLAYHIDMEEQLQITDYRGSEVGLMNIAIMPCNKKGKEYSEKDDVWVDDPAELVGRDLFFNFKIDSARGLPAKFTDFCAKFVIFDETDMTATKCIKDTINPDWKFKKLCSFCPVTMQLQQYLQNSAIMVQVWGRQKPPKQKKVVNTKNVLTKQALSKGMLSASNSNTKVVDAEKVRFAMELAVAKKKAEKAEMKVGQFRELVRLAEQMAKPQISTKLIKDLLNAPTKDVADKCLKMVAKEKGAEDSSVQTPPQNTAVTAGGIIGNSSQQPQGQQMYRKENGGGGGAAAKSSSTCVLL